MESTDTERPSAGAAEASVSPAGAGAAIACVICLGPDAERITSVSGPVEAVLGRSADALATTGLAALVHAGDRSALSAALRDLAATPGGTAACEVRLRVGDGAWRWFEVDVSDFARDPAIGAFVTRIRDVAERHAAEDRLRASEQRYRTLVDMTTTATVSVGPDGSFRVPQAVFARYTGQSWAEQRGWGWISIVHREDREHARQAFAQALRKREWFESRVRIWQAATATYRWWILRAVPVLDAAGEVREWFGIGIDIDEQATASLERQRVERELRASEARFRQLAETLPQLVWTAHGDGAVDYVNGRWVAYTGEPAERLLGWGWRAVFDPEALPAALERYRRALEAALPVELELRIRGADGAYRWHLLRTHPVRGADGSILQWVGTATDIDEQRRSAERLREADRGKDEFLAMLGHELRNPLAPIRNAAEVLRLSRPEDETVRWAQDVIARQLRHVTRLLDDLLDASRIRHGKVVLRKERVELLAVVATAVETARPKIDARRQELRVSLPPEPVRLLADPARLSQVVANLLDNACKYSEDGARIDLVAERDGADLVLSVRDFGIGMTPDVLPRVFDLFAQADRSLDRSQGGLGIGLTVVRRLVELHGGSVSASSDGAGRGSTFAIRLPLGGGEDAVAADRSTAGGRRAEPRRILVVDDDADAAESLSMLLELSGHAVRRAHGADSALEAAAAFRPEVALLDVALPGIDGYETGARLRRLLGPGVRIFAVTGYGRDEDRRRSLAAGFDGHLVKPVDVEALAARIDGRR